MTSAHVLRVSPIACGGRGLCAEIAPELITLDDWGFPIIEPGPIPTGLMAEAMAAVRICPLLALRLVEGRLARPLGAIGSCLMAGRGEKVRIPNRRRDDDPHSQEPHSDFSSLDRRDRGTCPGKRRWLQLGQSGSGTFPRGQRHISCPVRVRLG